MKALQFHEETKRLLGLAEDARLMFDLTGSIKWQGIEDYYRSLAEKMKDLAWHYACLEAEGIIKD